MRATESRSVLLLATLVACGSRTDLSFVPFPTATDAGAHATDAATSHTTGPFGPDAALAADAGAIVSDPCPSAVLVHSPLPMVGHCSTRDGRARVVGPKAPHVIWTQAVPPYDGNGEQALGIVAADAAGFAYLLSATGLLVSLTKVDGTSGAMFWSTPLSPVGEFSPGLFLTASAGLDAFTQPAQQVGGGLALDTLDLATGHATSSPIGGTPAEAGSAVGLPAVGTDGSFYVAYTVQAGTGAEVFFPVVTRVAADGSVAWTSHTIYAAGLPGVEYTAAVALGPGDAVIVAQTAAHTSSATVTALAPSTGTVDWSRTLPGVIGSPAVAPDGSIAVVTSTSSAQTLTVLEPTGAVRRTVEVSSTPSTFALPTVRILAIGLDGTIVLGGDSLFAVDSAGHMAWTAPGPAGASPGSTLADATIDASGTVVATYSKGIVGLDLATGVTRWTLAPPASVRCIGSATLTSSGGLVATACTASSFQPALPGLFGAAD